MSEQTLPLAAPTPEPESARPERKPVRGMRAYIVTMMVLGVMLMAAGAYTGYQLYTDFQMTRVMQNALNRDTFYDGISIDGIDISGMRREEAVEALTARVRALDASQSLTLEHNGQTWVIPASDFSYVYNIEEQVDRAYSIGREGTLRQRYEEIMAVGERKVALATTCAPGAIRSDVYVSRVSEALTRPAKNAAVDTFDTGTKAFTFSKEETGQRVDGRALNRMIVEAFQNRDFGAHIQVPVETVEPTVRLVDIQGKYRKLASYSTETTSNEARNTNIRLCSKAFHGARIEPGEVFSINDTTGRRTESKGYRAAGAIVNGTLVEEPGGGVCQVSTTLMNAVVRAGLEIVERSHHSWPSTYVDIGMDAAINYPDQDFKFRNNSEGTVFLVSSFDGRNLTISVYGYPILEEDERIDLSSVKTGSSSAPNAKVVYDYSLREGSRETVRKGRDEQRSKTYIHSYKGGKEVKKELLFTDTYRAIQGIIRVGTRPASVTASQ